MATHPSARGQKPEEVAVRPEGRNTIVTVSLLGAGVVVPRIDWGPDYESAANQLTIEQSLDATIDMGRQPLLWTYSQPDANYQAVKFGFDEHIGGGKIGHVAMEAQATISGEIFREGVSWSINNDSGAWGSMGGGNHRSAMLRQVAAFMSTRCGFQVNPKAAFSKYAPVRFFQKALRWSARQGRHVSRREDSAAGNSFLAVV